jgi:hypothetical protein
VLTGKVESFRLNAGLLGRVPIPIPVPVPVLPPIIRAEKSI